MRVKRGLHCYQVHRAPQAKKLFLSIEIGDESNQVPSGGQLPSDPIDVQLLMVEEFQLGDVKVTDFKGAEPMRDVVHYCYQGFFDTETIDSEYGNEI